MPTTRRQVAPRISGSTRTTGAHRGLYTVLVTKPLSLVCSRRARRAQPVAPVCQPEIAARAVAYAASASNEQAALDNQVTTRVDAPRAGGR
jgi:hypothetical protein